VEPAQVVRGVRFRPEAAGALLGIEPRTYCDEQRPLDAVLPELERSLSARLTGTEDVDFVAAFTASLRELLPGARTVDPLVRAAVDVLTLTDGAMPIGEVARRVCLSERQLQRRFGAAVGLTPKQFARIRRLRSTVGDALSGGDAGWSRLAAQLGYADQAHMVREFSALTGQSPENFLAHTRRIEHVDVRP
jgi:AraC-like DNA-binding protein